MGLEADFCESKQAAKNREGADSVFGEEIFRGKEWDVEEEADFEIRVQALHDHAS